MAKTNAQSDQNPQDESKGEQLQPKSELEIERIRQIIFGSQMRQYEQATATIQQDMQRIEQETATLNQQLTDRDINQSQAVQKLRQEMRDAVSSLRSEVRQVTQQLEEEKVGRQLLGELFIELGNQIKTGGSLANLLHGLLKVE